MAVKCSYLWCVLILVCSAGLASAQEEAVCYGPGSIATSVILTFVITLLLLAGGYYAWRKYRSKKEHLILETDPEKGKGEYAFDNPGFKDTSLLPVSKTLENNKLEASKSKWNQWSPLSALTTKSEKRKTVDDTALEANEVKVVALRSHDFTGLGFNICGNMKEGIYIKDILHRGPAFESGKLNTGDRINSVTISFEHMVYEDALTILSYASPYEVMIEAKGGKLIHSNTPGQGGQPSHPVYRSSSCTDLYHVEKSSKKKLFGDDFTGSLSSNYSSLQKSRSNMTTLERKESKSPMPGQMHPKKAPAKHLTPEQLKTQLEQRILADHQHNLKAKEKPQRIDVETQKTENKHQKFGIRVLPLEQQKSPKSMEQNENNINIEKNLEPEPVGIDEVDEPKKQAPQVKKREKRPEGSPEKEDNFERSSLQGSGIKRDQNGIPQEIPSHMLNAAVAARKNRKNSDDVTKEEEDSKAPKRKGKAPSPPEETKTKESTSKPNFDEIQLLDEDISPSTVNKTVESMENLELEVRSSNEEIKDYNSDSDMETDNQSSVNTIELNSSEITIHQTEEEERQNRRTASTGDLSKIQRTRKTSTGTLERAQSLDITDTGIPALTKKRKGGRIEDSFDMKSDEDLFGKALLNKEPRLSLILDGLNTFQRNRLKKSTEWGNLEDAILKLNQEDENITQLEEHKSLDNIQFNIDEQSPELDALVNKIKEIKRESLEIEPPKEIVETFNVKTEKKIKNQIWPTFDDELVQTSNGSAHIFQVDKESKIDLEVNERRWTEPAKTYEKRQQIPVAPERTYRPPSPAEEIDSKTNVADKKSLGIEEGPVMLSTAEKRQIKPSTFYDFPPPEYEQDAKITFSKIELHPKVPERANMRQRVPDELLIVGPPTTEKIEIVPEAEVRLKEDWNISVSENIMNTSPPPSLEIEEELAEEPIKVEEVRVKPPSHSSTTVLNRSEEVLSKIPLLNSMVKSQKEEALKKPVLSTNSTDETKTVVTYNTRPFQPNLLDVTQNFLYTEQLNCSQDDYSYSIKPYDTNVSDDIKVSRHSHESLERQKSDVVPKSDDAKSEDSLRHISNVNVTNIANGDSELHSLELSINEPSELYTTALDSSIMTEKQTKSDSKVTISTPDLIKNVTLAEAISTLNNDVTVRTPTTLTVEIPKDLVGVTESKFSTLTESPRNVSSDKSSDNDGSKNSSTLTYITEIQVTPNNSASTNISEIEIIPNISTESNKRNLDSEFENYVKSFESKLEHFETNIKDFDKNLEEFIKEEPKSIVINEKVDEKELHKIQEIAEEQLKKLPEMRFTTSSYESSKIPEKRHSQIELLRSNFEKAPPKLNKPDVAPKSRIPIATTTKTPPTSPERRDSKNLDMENDKAILELMSSSVTSTPYTTSKYQIKPPSKNVTVTSIRSNSKIPSGLPTLSANRPPIAPRKMESNEGNIVQVSTNGSFESSFKQWVFNPSNVTNVVVTESKQDKS